MTVQEYLDLTDALAPGGVGGTVALRLRFLGEIEGRVRVELLGQSPDTISPMDADTPRETLLAVPHPYDRLYWMYALAMSDYLAGDGARYENAAALFNEAYAGYGRYLKRQEA